MVSNIFDEIISILPEITEHHKPGSRLYNVIKCALRSEVKKFFSATEKISRIDFGPFGKIVFPYYKLGSAMDSMNLFDLDEVIIFSFYWSNRHQYRTVLDLGANIGLHSTLLAKCGFDVSSYEPDPFHLKYFKENIYLNNISNTKIFNEAVSIKKEVVEFTRVCGNTMSSHISGCKSPYGDLEYFSVQTVPYKSINKNVDFVKMDVEAHEKTIIKNTNYFDWLRTDAMISIHDAENAEIIFDHLQALGVNIFSQKINWQLAETLEDMPDSHHDGSIFVSTKSKMPWGGIS